jgi:hypothetical protein
MDATASIGGLPAWLV